jgi:hypothetical protein
MHTTIQTKGEKEEKNGVEMWLRSGCDFDLVKLVMPEQGSAAHFKRIYMI